jgi:predicted SAM-dependent methyltransferase
MHQTKQKIVKMLYRSALLVFSTRTLRLMWFDLIRLKARNKNYGQKDIVPLQSKLHFGCGSQYIQGWLNVDLMNSDYDIDLACGRLPWKVGVFDAAIGQHVVEHLELVTEFIPLLRELHRVLKPGAEIWLSCPDIEKVCRSYLEHNMVNLLEDRKKRFPCYSLGEIPTQHMINDIFHQCSEQNALYGFKPLNWTLGEHKNLYDFTLLEWALTGTGFTEVKRVVESDFLSRFPEFPPRNDDLQSIYVRAMAS